MTASPPVRQQAPVAALVAFSAATGATVIAEGRETAADRSCVERLGVALGRGSCPGPRGTVRSDYRRGLVSGTTLIVSATA